MNDEQPEAVIMELNTAKLSVRKAKEIAGYLRIHNANVPVIEQVIVTSSRPSFACVGTWKNCMAICHYEVEYEKDDANYVRIFFKKREYLTVGVLLHEIAHAMTPACGSRFDGTNAHGDKFRMKEKALTGDYLDIFRPHIDGADCHNSIDMINRNMEFL